MVSAPKFNRVLWEHIMRHLAGNCLWEKQCIFQSYDEREIWIILRLAPDGYRAVLQLMCLMKIKLKHRAINIWCVSPLKYFINPPFLLEFWSLRSQRPSIQVSSPHQRKIRCSHHLRKRVMKREINVFWWPQTSRYRQSSAFYGCSLSSSWLVPLSFKLRE